MACILDSGMERQFCGFVLGVEWTSPQPMGFAVHFFFGGRHRGVAAANKAEIDFQNSLAACSVRSPGLEDDNTGCCCQKNIRPATKTTRAIIKDRAGLARGRYIMP